MDKFGERLYEILGTHIGRKRILRPVDWLANDVLFLTPKTVLARFKNSQTWTLDDHKHIQAELDPDLKKQYEKLILDYLAK